MAVASPRAGSAAGIALAALHVPDGPLEFQGLIPYPPVAVTSAAAAAAALSPKAGGQHHHHTSGGGGGHGVDDWGLTLEQQVTAVERFRALLDSRGQWSREHHDYYTLLRFLRARNYDLDKASAMWRDSLEWRAALGADTMLEPASRGGFVFHEREQFLMAYPQGYHKTDKMVRPCRGCLDPSVPARAHTQADDARADDPSPPEPKKNTPHHHPHRNNNNRAAPSTSSCSGASTPPPSAPSPPRTAWSSSTSRSTSGAQK